MSDTAKTSSAKRQTRTTRRNKVSSVTVAAVSGDTWLLVCANLYFSPACVLKLMRTSKNIWLTLRDNPAWWKTFFDRVVLYQSMLTKSNCLATLNELGQHNKNKRAVIHLVFSSECCGCEGRYGHSIFKPLMKRLCQTCIHDKLISNRVLMYKYGIHFSDFVVEYSEKGGILMFHAQTKPITASFLRVTSEMLDLNQRTDQKGARLLFFDKNFLKETLGIDLSEAFKETRKNKTAVQTLLACFRRLRTQHFLINASRHMLLGAEAARKHEITRSLHPLKVCTLWMLGGPYYSFPAYSTAAGRACINGTNFKLRKGMTLEMVRRIEACVNDKGINLES